MQSENVINEILEFTTFKNVAIAFGNAVNNTDKIARQVLANCPKFVDDCPKEVKADIMLGFTTQYADSAESKAKNEGLFILVDSNYISAEQDKFDSHTGDKYTLSVANAMAYSTQEVTSMSVKNKPLAELVKPVRARVQKYTERKFKKLVSTCKEVLAEDKPAPTRPKSLEFETWFKSLLGDIKKRRTNSDARGDSSAPSEKALLAGFKAMQEKIAEVDGKK
jgi:hypothetical protein